MLRAIKAVLVTTVEFRDILGNKRTLPVGQEIKVTRIVTPKVSSTSTGKIAVESDGWIGILGVDSFDLAPFEFRVEN